MSKKIEKPSYEELNAEYAKEGVTISSLAKSYNTSNPTIRKWLIEYGIERKSQKQASIEANNRHKNKIKPTKEELEYVYQYNSIKDIEKLYSISQDTVYEWLNYYNIDIKSLSSACKAGKKKQFKYHYNISKEDIENVYDKSKPISCLADALGVSMSFIKGKLKEYDITVDPKYRSKNEIELYNYCKEKYPEYSWKYCDRTIISPFELDIVNEDKKIAIEYCGTYWHSEMYGGKKMNYHYDKYLKCKEMGYKLITIFESDDISKVKNLINSLIGKNKRIYARDTIAKQITASESKDFLNVNHMHGFVGASLHYGLFHKDKLVMVCSFGIPRYNSKYEFEIIRMASENSTTIVGGASKLFNFFVKEKNPNSCHTFADLRFGDGEVYLKCGFEYDGISKPNYWYFHKYKPLELFSRVKFQKHKLNALLEEYDETKTEYDNMKNNGWDRIWDCGNNKYIWKKEKER